MVRSTSAVPPVVKPSAVLNVDSIVDCAFTPAADSPASKQAVAIFFPAAPRR